MGQDIIQEHISDSLQEKREGRKGENTLLIHLTTRYGIIGDLHESVEALKLVMAELRKKQVTKFVLVGDLIDKGNACLETLQFISDNINLFYIVRGNHEVAVSLFIFLLSHFLFLFHCTFPFIALKFFFFFCFSVVESF